MLYKVPAKCIVRLETMDSLKRTKICAKSIVLSQKQCHICDKVTVDAKNDWHTLYTSSFHTFFFSFEFWSSGRGDLGKDLPNNLRVNNFYMDLIIHLDSHGLKHGISKRILRFLYAT